MFDFQDVFDRIGSIPVIVDGPKPAPYPDCMQIEIRPEAPSDIAQIYQLTKTAFAPMPFSAGDEQDVLERLRDNDRLSLSLVAMHGDALVGHIAFSRMLIGGEPADWYALGPVAADPKVQKRGIGSALIREGISRLTRAGARGIALTGDPAYYARFGFAVSRQWAPPNEPAKYFQVLAINSIGPSAILHFDPAFYEPSA